MPSGRRSAPGNTPPLLPQDERQLCRALTHTRNFINSLSTGKLSLLPPSPSFSRKIRYFRGIKQQRKRGNVPEISACLRLMGVLLDCSRSCFPIILNTDVSPRVARHESRFLCFPFPPPFSLFSLPYARYPSSQFSFLFKFSFFYNGIGQL